MNFTEAVEALKSGKKVRLQGQKGYSYVEYCPEIHANKLMYKSPDLIWPIRAFFTWKDVLAEDWELVENDI